MIVRVRGAMAQLRRSIGTPVGLVAHRRRDRRRTLVIVRLQRQVVDYASGDVPCWPRCIPGAPASPRSATPTHLLRAAKFHGKPSSVMCPICRKEPLTLVSWVSATTWAPSPVRREPPKTGAAGDAVRRVLRPRRGGLPHLRVESPGQVIRARCATPFEGHPQTARAPRRRTPTRARPVNSEGRPTSRPLRSNQDPGAMACRTVRATAARVPPPRCLPPRAARAHRSPSAHAARRSTDHRHTAGPRRHHAGSRDPIEAVKAALDSPRAAPEAHTADGTAEAARRHRPPVESGGRRLGRRGYPSRSTGGGCGARCTWPPSF